MLWVLLVICISLTKLSVIKKTSQQICLIVDAENTAMRRRDNEYVRKPQNHVIWVEVLDKK